MYNIVIMFRQGEITLATKHEVQDVLGTSRADGTKQITGVQFHPDDEPGIAKYLRYVDYDQVIAVLQYNADDDGNRKDGQEHGKETG